MPRKVTKKVAKEEKVLEPLVIDEVVVEPEEIVIPSNEVVINGRSYLKIKTADGVTYLNPL